MKVLYKQLAGSELEQTDVPMGTGLDDVLETIRIQWEKVVEKNRAEAGALLQAKVRDRPASSPELWKEGGQARRRQPAYRRKAAI